MDFKEERKNKINFFIIFFFVFHFFRSKDGARFVCVLNERKTNVVAKMLCCVV